MKRVYVVFSWFLIFLIGLCFQANAFGREGTFGLYPAEFKGTMNPGQIGMFELFVYNNTGQTSEFVVTVMGCGIDRSGVRYYPAPEEAGEYSAAQWVRLKGMYAGSTIRVSPNEKHSILAEVHVPVGTRPGEYYAVIFVEPVEFNVVERGALKFQTKSRIGAVVKVLVPGPTSAFDMRSSVSEIWVDMPDNETVDQFRSILEALDNEMIVTDSFAHELSSFLQTLGVKFVYEDYRLWSRERQEEYAQAISEFLEQIWLERESVRITATLSTEARRIILAKGEVSIYQDFVDENGRRQRILRDHFTLTPAGSSIRGEEKVFPGGMRDFFGTIQRPLPVGEYTAEVRFEYRGEDETNARFALGHTTFSVPQELAIRQKEMLVLGVDPDLLVYNMAPGEYHVKAVTIENLDVVEPLEIQLSTNVDWIEISSSTYKLQPGRKQSIRVAVRMPRDVEFVDRTGKILVLTDRGKATYIDVQVRDKRETN
jgi:hypothetical protein